MRQKIVDAGRITGLNAYEMAVASGKFTGTLEEFLAKELETYNNMKSYSDQAKADMDKKLASLTEDASLSEVVDARDSYDTLGNRIDAVETAAETLVERVNSVVSDATGDIITNAYIDEDGYLVMVTKQFEEDDHVGNGRVLEIRNNGSALQWRYIGFKNWTNLIALSDITPNLKIGKVETVEPDVEAEVEISGSPFNPLMNLKIPRGQNGGDIINATLNDKGELIITVANSDDVLPTGISKPSLSIGTVTTLGEDEEATASITGTASNPVLNLGIPRGKSTKAVRARQGDDGFLYFDFE